jgi:paraquat-inducible protein A
MSVGANTAAAHGLIACHTCGLVCRRPPVSSALRCPRCRTTLHARIPRSLSRSWAFLVAAMLLYLPANLLPIMHVTSFGDRRSDTIFSGVEYLLLHGMWPLALIVFVASVLVPVAKIAILVYLLISVQLSSRSWPWDRMRLYRFTEYVGRWSMVDVFVVTVLVALIDLGQVAQVEAGPGALMFACVVVLTMFAARTFDPRLIWDRAEPADVEPTAS